jgi:hypothetical protein
VTLEGYRRDAHCPSRSGTADCGVFLSLSGWHRLESSVGGPAVAALCGEGGRERER